MMNISTNGFNICLTIKVNITTKIEIMRYINICEMPLGPKIKFRSF